MKNKKLIPAILNLFTLMGGHLYNKRYDRIVVFTTVLLVAYIVSWYVVSLFMDRMFKEGMELNGFDSIKWIYVGQLVGLVLLLIISAITGYIDGAKNQQPLTGINKWISRIAGMALAGFAMFLIGAHIFLVFSLDITMPENVADAEQGKSRTSTSRRWFSSDTFFLNGTKFKRYDGSFDNHNLPDPPAGNVVLTGEFQLDGVPIPGIIFDMVIDGQYRAKKIQTDANGRFTIPIKPGTWHIDYLHITAWDDKPSDRKLALISGREGKLKSTQFEEHRFLDFNEGLPVEISEDGEQKPPLVFPIRDKLELVQPNADTTGLKVTTNNFNIRWQAYPEAKHYLVKLSELTREDKSVSYHPAAHKKVTDATQLSLADLKTVSHDGGPLEYQIQVFAFDENNNYLSQSDNFFDESTIILTDGKKIIDADVTKMFGDAQSFNAKNYEKMRKNGKRLDAVKILIQDKLYPEAQTLLDKVHGKTEPGAKDAITAYLLAEQNQCEQAKKYYEKAKQASTSGCVPECYMKNCQE
jgi:hypothetical protein